MRRRYVTVAISMIAVGLLFSAGALAALGFDFSRLSTTKYEENTTEITKGFSSIEITDTTSKITLVHSPDEKCTVVCSEAENRRHSAVIEDGVLRIRKNDTSKWYENVGFNIGEESVTVYLPAKGYDSLSVTVDTGDVTIAKDFEFNSIRIRGSTADVDCFAYAVNTMEICVSTGEILLREIRTGALTLQASTGRIEVSSALVAGAIQARTSTGRITLKDVTCGDTSLSTDTGRVTLTRFTSEGSLHVETDTGDVSFDACDAETISVKTATGDVEGSLRTDKIFYTSTSTGRIRVPKTTAGGSCEITTGTGDVTITIGS